MTPALKVAGAALAVVLVLAVLATGGAAGVLADPATVACTLTPGTAGTTPGMGGASAGSSPGAGTGLDAEQWTNASTIVGVAAQRQLPTRAAVIAIATALQESGLRNLPYGDADSLGLFQQRPSQGWGTPAQVMDPTYAATAFYAALTKTPRWQDLPVTVAAQQVQRSAAPNAYAQQEALATTIVTALTAGACLPGGTSSPAAQRALTFALAQLGLPYQWGGDGLAHGDNGFDCSGLTTAAYAAAGIRLPRIAQAQYDVGPRLAPGVPLRPGDLLFFGTPTNVHHVGIYLTNHHMINAAHAGTPVRVEDYTSWPDLLAASRPALDPALSG